MDSDGSDCPEQQAVTVQSPGTNSSLPQVDQTHDSRTAAQVPAARLILLTLSLRHDSSTSILLTRWVSQPGQYDVALSLETEDGEEWIRRMTDSATAFFAQAFELPDLKARLSRNPSR